MIVSTFSFYHLVSTYDDKKIEGLYLVSVEVQEGKDVVFRPVPHTDFQMAARGRLDHVKQNSRVLRREKSHSLYSTLPFSATHKKLRKKIVFHFFLHTTHATIFWEMNGGGGEDFV